MPFPKVAGRDDGPGWTFVVLGLLWLLGGCDHTEPFETRAPGTTQPFDPRPPARLTLNRGPDRGPAWLPDGSGILYSYQEPERQDHDVCLALLPPGGGSRLWEACNLSPTGDDSTDALESPAAASDGGLAYQATTSAIAALTPGSVAIVLATLGDPVDRRVVLDLPFSADGRIYSRASRLRWLDDERLLYLGEAVVYRRPCPAPCPPDTLTAGLDLSLLELTGGTRQRIPGTDYATGVSVAADGTAIYYTLGGDSRLYRRILAGGEVSVVHDFGAGGTVRDVHVVGSRAAAIVGGRVTFAADRDLGPVQWDSGGIIHLLDLDTGADQVLEGPGLFRRPALSPAGDRVVAEGYPLIITTAPGNLRDTVVARDGDLYLFGAP